MAFQVEVAKDHRLGLSRRGVTANVPFPSSPHCAPRMIVADIVVQVLLLDC
jgi:hypothetical protein